MWREKPFPQDAEAQAHNGQPDKAQDKIREDHSARRQVIRLKLVTHQQQNQRRRDRCREETAEIRQAEVGEQSRELPEQQQQNKLEREHARPMFPELPAPIGRHVEIKSQLVGEEMRNHQHCRIAQQQKADPQRGN